jgi:MFS family permease
MLPDLRDHFGVDSATISWTISAYLLPMAGLLLVSGTLGERFGRERILRGSLAVYLAASLLVAASPGLSTFLAARALQGAANAFFTPLLLAGLADNTPEDRLGRRIGMYASFQAVGGAAAPFVGGLAAELDWRAAFVVTAACTLVILIGAPRAPSGATTARPPIRPLLAPRLLALGLSSFASTAGPLGAQVLVGFKIRDELGIEPGPAGLLLAAGFIGPALLGPSFGRLTDRFGARLCGALSTLAVGLAVGLIGPVDAAAAVTGLWLVAGSLFGFVTVVLHRVAAVIVPDNRGGALSAVLSFRFLGLAVGPLIWVPVLDRSVDAAFYGSGLLGLVTIAALLSAVPATPPAPATPDHARRSGPAPSAGRRG